MLNLIYHLLTNVKLISPFRMYNSQQADILRALWSRHQ